MICYKVCVRIPALCSFRDERRRESPQHVTTLRNEILADYFNETQVWGKVRIIIIYENQPVDSTRNFDQSRVSMPAVYTATKRRIAPKCNQSAGHTCVGVFPAQGQGGHWRDEEVQLGERDQVGRDLVQIDVWCQNHRGNRERKPTITERKWKYIEIVSGEFLATTLKICRTNGFFRPDFRIQHGRHWAYFYIVVPWSTNAILMSNDYY